MSESRILFGQKEMPPGAVPLKAGALEMLYDEGSLRYITYDGIEILRMIFASVRNKEWLTVKPEISGFGLTKDKSGFRLSFRAHYRSDEIDFMAYFSVKASSEGYLVFDMKGKALSTFRKNRIGFCVLHPIANCAGKTCHITHPDKTTTPLRFPVDVASRQPFTDIAGMRWMAEKNLTVELSLRGDVFETEDQRNWTDASYKTYCTPLALPYPVVIRQGQEIIQQVEMKIRGELLKAERVRAAVNTFSITHEETGILPDIGIGISSRQRSPSTEEGNMIRKIGFSHLQANLMPDDLQDSMRYGRIAAEAEKTGLPVELFLFFGRDPEKELRDFLRMFRKIPFRIKSILLLSKTHQTTPDPVIKTVLPKIKEELTPVPTGAGTNCNFAQLNRSVPDASGLDFLSFAIHPQEHADDYRTLTENLAGQYYTVRTALQFKGCKPVHVSPVTLRRRFNANIENYESTAYPKGMPSQIDPRQMSLFGASWTVGSLKYLLESGAGSITYFETLGERGIMMGDDDSGWPEQFPAQKGMLFPLFHVFRILLQYKGSRIVRCVSSRPLLADGFALKSGKKGIIFLANMVPGQLRLQLTGINACRTILSMHPGNYDRWCLEQSIHQSVPRISHTGRPVEIMLRPCESRIMEYNPI
jgi:hypothetical protein